MVQVVWSEKSHCGLSGLVLELCHQVTGCLRSSETVDGEGPCKRGVLLKDGCSYS